MISLQPMCGEPVTALGVFKKKIMKKLIIISIMLCVSCTSSNDFEKGRKQLEQQGYVNVKNTGYNWFCCDEKDTFSTGFYALDKEGNKVKGCICSGVLKGVTIRFE